MPFRLLNKEAGKHCKLNGVNHIKTGIFLNINDCRGMQLKTAVGMVTAQWHPSPFAQRWSSADLSAPRQSLVHLPTQKQ